MSVDKPLNVVAHELLIGKTCEYGFRGWMDWDKFSETEPGFLLVEVPQYDTDIAAAWRLVDALIERGLHVNIRRYPDGESICEVIEDLADHSIGKNGWSSAKTVPLAITQTYVQVCAPQSKEEQQS